jgi:hypothetical protein
MSLLVWVLASALSAEPAQLESDEFVMFFPTWSHFDPQAQAWRVPIHGWLYENEKTSFKRNLGLRLFRRYLRLDEDFPGSDLFRQRASMFVVENCIGRQLSILLGNRVQELPPSGSDGHVHGALNLSVAEADGLAVRTGVGRTLPFRTVLDEGDLRVLAGSAQLIGERGFSVISDIDDTIKITDVVDRREMLLNAFTREFEPVPGMAAVYRRWNEAGAVFHYVSAMPWQLYPPLPPFLSKAGFPAGSIDMQPFRLIDRKSPELLASQNDYKRQTIEPIFKAFPQRKFILLGDTGLHDPEIYGGLARNYPERIAKIYIRNITGDRPESERLAKAFAEVPAERWQLFSDADEIAADLP